MPEFEVPHESFALCSLAAPRPAEDADELWGLLVEEIVLGRKLHLNIKIMKSKKIEFLEDFYTKKEDKA